MAPAGRSPKKYYHFIFKKWVLYGCRQPSPTAAIAGEDNKLRKTITAAQVVAVAAFPLLDTCNDFSLNLSTLDFISGGKLNILDLFMEKKLSTLFIFKIIRKPATANAFKASIQLANMKIL